MTFNVNCSSECAAPILSFHGTGDKTISYTGGLYRNDTLIDIDVYRKEWAIRNGCQPNSTISYLSNETDPLQTIEISTWDQNCREGGVVIGYRINEGEHAWPRTTLPSKCNGIVSTGDCTTTVFNATQTVIIPFFNDYALTN